MAIEVEVEVKRRRFTVDEYHRMIETGILREGERIELITRGGSVSPQAFPDVVLAVDEILG